jgi:hypothetical protein
MEAELGITLPDAADEDHFGSDRAADGERVFFPALPARETVPGNDPEPGNVGEAVNNAAGNADGKVFKIGIGSRKRGGKRKDSNGVDERSAPWGGAAVGGDKESVATFWKSFDEVGSFCRIAEGFAEFVDGLVEAVVEIDKRVGGPEAAAEFLASDDLAGRFEEHGEDLEGLILETETMPVVAEFTRTQIELIRAEANRA